MPRPHSLDDTADDALGDGPESVNADAWQAYAAGLRAGSDAAARPHMDAYRTKDAEADGYARQLGQMFRRMQ